MLIFIIGYMAAGKTVFGRRLANELNYRFLDLDELIEERHACSISDYFLEFGEESFRHIERATLLELLNDENTVIATGGGTPCYLDNMSRMNEAGLTLFLDTKPEVIIQRLRIERTLRPLLNAVADDQLSDYINMHYSERRKCYEQSKKLLDPMKDDDVDEFILFAKSI